VIYVKDFKGRDRAFEDADKHIAELYAEVDTLEEKIRDKYFYDDIEHIKGADISRKVKGQLRRMADDMKLLRQLPRGMPDEKVE